MREPISQASVNFRSKIIDALQAGGRRVGYITADSIDAACPRCGGALAVTFHGHAPRADLTCLSHACDEQELSDALARVRRAA